jgi:acylphosphatase
MTAEARVRVRVSGRVQGVNYRWETKRAAERAGVRGWVRNRGDGTVEAVFEGARAALEAMLDWCRRGPPHAAVQTVTVDWESCCSETAGFEIRYGG